MICFHRRDNLGDKHKYTGPEDFDFSKTDIVLPLFLYDHSGITMNTTGFSCPWDSGQVGVIVARAAKIKAEFGNLKKETKEHVITILKSEVSTYDQFLRGDIYGFVLEDENGDEIDSCWGFYGENPLENGMSEHLDAEACKALEIALK
jgi:hypothetical protein